MSNYINKINNLLNSHHLHIGNTYNIDGGIRCCHIIPLADIFYDSDDTIDEIKQYSRLIDNEYIPFSYVIEIDDEIVVARPDDECPLRCKLMPSKPNKNIFSVMTSKVDSKINDISNKILQIYSKQPKATKYTELKK